MVVRMWEGSNVVVLQELIHLKQAIADFEKEKEYEIKRFDEYKREEIKKLK